MPRKTHIVDPALAAGLRRFNEAAARCRGKLGAGQVAQADSYYASMRPRPDAAENGDPPRYSPRRAPLQ